MSQSTTRHRAAVVRVQAVRERTLTYEATISGPSAMATAVRALIGEHDREAFVVVHLNAKHKIVSLEVVAVGTLSATLVHPREVFKGALLANAAAIGLAHNHPSGDPTPSPEDLALTAQLLAAGEVVGVRVLDHIVLGDDRHVSLRDTTMLWQDTPFHR